MKVFAVFDTNILVSALISRRSDTAVVLALETLLSGEVIPLYNDEILLTINQHSILCNQFNEEEYCFYNILKIDKLQNCRG